MGIQDRDYMHDRKRSIQLTAGVDRWVIQSSQWLFQLVGGLILVVALIHSLAATRQESDAVCQLATVRFDVNGDGRFTYRDLGPLTMLLFTRPALLTTREPRLAPVAEFLELKRSDCASVRSSIFSGISWLTAAFLITVFFKIWLHLVRLALRSFFFKAIGLNQFGATGKILYRLTNPAHNYFGGTQLLVLFFGGLTVIAVVAQWNRIAEHTGSSNVHQTGVHKSSQKPAVSEPNQRSVEPEIASKKKNLVPDELGADLLIATPPTSEELRARQTGSHREKSKLPIPTVRFVYMISSDRLENPEFTKAIESAAIEVQSWYEKQLDGFTFRLRTPIVDVVKAPVRSDYYATNPLNRKQLDWGVFNCAKVAEQVVGGRFFDPKHIWIIYVDATDFGGQGGSGFACMSEQDLYGLVGKRAPNTNRWLGGLAHELGHALGLTHPMDFVQSNYAVMAFGFYFAFPNETYLTEDDKVILRRSTYLYRGQDAITGPVQDLFYYKDGWFEKRDGNYWYENRYDQTTRYTFSELESDTMHKLLFDTSRNLFLKLPNRGGMAQFSLDQKRTWRDVLVVSKSKI
jgi:hypothetical protein